jgi:peroxiredoxin
MEQPTRSPSLLERPLLRTAVASLVALAVIGGAVTYFSVRDDGGSAPAEAAGALDDRSPVRGEPAPDFELVTSEGEVVQLSDLRGSVVLVNFWATWCTPCKKELPAIQAIYDEKRDEGLEVLEVNVQEDADSAAAFFEDRDLTLPLLLDAEGEVYQQYGLQGLPDSFFVDREGNIAAVNFGYLPEKTMRERLADAGLP